MTDYDFIQICKLLQREDNDISCRLVQLQNTYQVFRRYDELDLLELLSLKIRQQYHSELEQKLLALCDYLMRYNKE